MAEEADLGREHLQFQRNNGGRLFYWVVGNHLSRRCKTAGQLKEQQRPPSPLFQAGGRAPRPGRRRLVLACLGSMKVGFSPSCRCKNGCIYTSPASTTLSRLPLLLSLPERPTNLLRTRLLLASLTDSFFNTPRRNNAADQNTESRVQSPSPAGRTARPHDSILTTATRRQITQLALPWTHHHLISTNSPLLWPASFSGTSMGRSYHSLAEFETQKTTMPMSRPSSTTKISIHPSNISILPASQSTRIQSSGIDRPPAPATPS